VRAPGTPREQALLCYTDSVYAATEAHVDAAMRAVYDGLLRLEASLPADSPVRSVQVRQRMFFTRHAGGGDDMMST
jgi:hypothetical protein